MDTLIELTRVSTSTLATVLFEMGYRQQFLVGLTSYGGKSRFVGEAYTMRLIPGRRDLGDKPGVDLFRETVDTVPPGSVIVVDNMRDPSAACLGDLMATRLAYRKVAGLVTDGAVRDIAGLAGLDLAVHAGSVSATSRKAFFHLAGTQELVSCAGVAVVPGDIVVGDEDGVLVIPRQIADEVLADAKRREDFEVYVALELKRGAQLTGMYPPAAPALARYAEWESAGRPMPEEDAPEQQA